MRCKEEMLRERGGQGTKWKGESWGERVQWGRGQRDEAGMEKSPQVNYV